MLMSSDRLGRVGLLFADYTRNRRISPPSITDRLPSMIIETQLGTRLRVLYTSMAETST
jgi:hypothetical protein